ncbi:hypothetical protein DFH06DRAFT_1297980 [Mycena polygramma]|nr:hypothetical protein DFH06DRAFT_1297980 [Mycena polygramma]
MNSSMSPPVGLGLLLTEAFLLDLESVLLTGGITALLSHIGHLSPATDAVDGAKSFLARRRPFSEAKWDQLSAHFGVPGSHDDPLAFWTDLTVPEILLPLSVVKDLIMKTIQGFVYTGSHLDLTNQTATGQFKFHSAHLLSLFGGILRRLPEASSSGADLNSGGKVEDAIYCREYMLIFIRERKLEQKLADSVAQVMCELWAVWQLNCKANVDVQPHPKLIPVRACLTDGPETHFLQFDGERFSRRTFERIRLLPGRARIEQYAEHALPIYRYMFALLLDGYYGTLELYYQRSIQNDPPAPSYSLTAGSMPLEDRASPSRWFDSLRLAYEAQEYLRYAFRANSDAPAEKGLEALYASLTQCPSHGGNLILPATVKQWTAALMNQYRSGLVPDPTPNYRPQLRLFPLSIQAQRDAAVNEFWSWMPPELRSELEYTTREPNGDSYSTLAAMSEDPDSQTGFLCKYTSPALAWLMTTALHKARQRNHWGIVLPPRTDPALSNIAVVGAHSR